jgi:hypothetical protein
VRCKLLTQEAFLTRPEHEVLESVRTRSLRTGHVGLAEVLRDASMDP